MNQCPIMVISDCPSQSSGLARITRDLCTLLVGMPEFRVATLGKYGLGSARLPWTQYQMQADEWGNVSLPLAWDEFSQDQPGIVMTIWDVTRLLWLARPEYCEDEGLRGWLQDRRRRRFKLWGYVPVDATGPRNRLSTMSKECLLGFDRLLAYTPWGMGIVRNTIGEEEAVRRGLDWIGHGINTRTFTPRAISNRDTRVGSVRPCTREELEHDEELERLYPLIHATIEEGAIVDLEPQGRVAACDASGVQEEIGPTLAEAIADSPAEQTYAKLREMREQGEVMPSAGLQPIREVEGGHGASVETSDKVVEMPSVAGGSDGEAVNVKRVGIVMTNQARKDWGLAAATCAGIVERLQGDVRFWWHCDTPIRHFSLPALVADFGLGEYMELTTPPMSDQKMAEWLRACDLTLHTGAEGFGLPIFESLACGVPAIHGDYAGGASIMASCGLARYLVQPVAWRLESQHNCLRPVYEPEDWVRTACEVLAIKPDAAWLAGQVSHMSWMKLGHVWKRYFREGLGNE